jgi:serine/threonine-protein kinase
MTSGSLETAAMTTHGIVTELLLRMEEDTSVSPETLCKDYEGHPDYAVLLEKVKQEKRNLAAVAAQIGEERGAPRAKPEKPPAGDASSGQTATAREWDLRGPRYYPTTFHAEGGQGEVFRGEDMDLGRPVALKRLRKEMESNPAIRQRFVAEAEITARLQHPGIVPVYELVRDAAGKPFYAMRFIEGEPLNKAIEKLHARGELHTTDHSLALRKLLTHFMTACETVAYAHSRGVVHRDLKPRNIMLGEYGETLVIDWGLAKPAPSVETETQTPVSDLKMVEGTFQYMSPEQAEGQQNLGPASDIFSLGATLYHILTGHAPYLGPSKLKTWQQAKALDCPRPCEIKKDIPRALEAICLKAMALEPDDRYATAKALAGDLEQWMADEPVTAYREPWTVKARRWLGRHRTLATSAAATLVVVVLSLAALATLLTVHNKELTAANSRERDARDLADQQRERAQNNFRLVGTIYRDIGRSSSAVSAIEKARADTERLAKEHPDVPEYQQLKLHSLFNLGRLYKDAGRIEDAEKAYKETLAAATVLAMTWPDVPDYQAFRGHSLGSLGILYSSTNRYKQAEKAYEQALDIRQGLADKYPDEPEYPFRLSLAYANLGTLYLETGPSKQSEAAFRKAKELQQQLVNAYPREADYHAELSNTYYNLGLLYANIDRLKEAEESYLTALAMREQLVKAYPRDGEYQADLASSHNNLGTLYRETKRVDQALGALKKVVNIRQELVNTFPTIAKYQAELATGFHNLAFLFEDLKKPKDAESNYKKALAIQKSLVALQPLSAEYQVDLARTNNSLGTLYIDTKNFEAAETHVQEARTILERLVGVNGKDLDAVNELGNSYGNLGSVMRSKNRPATGVAWYLRAIRTFERVLARDLQNAYARDSLSSAQFAKTGSLIAAAALKPAAAVKDWEEAAELAPQPDRGFCRLQRARARTRQGDHARAVAEAVDLGRGKASKDVTLYDLACVCSLAGAAVAKDVKLPAGEQRRLAESYGAQAVTFLQQARAAGFFKDPANLAKLKKANDLEAIRLREDFKTLVEALEKQ